MRRSTATAVPVEKDPYPPEVRAEISQLVRDLYPTEVEDIRVERMSPDWAIITYGIPTTIGERYVREVYFDQDVEL